jgi:ketosteroid isomerase-like protein
MHKRKVTTRSSANLDLVRSIYADWERGDFGRSDWADPSIEYSWADGPAPRAWRGLEGMAEANRDLLSLWDGVWLAPIRYREVDDDRVFVQFAQHGTGKTSGLDSASVHAEGAHLFEIHDGFVTRLVFYWDGSRALADLGLAPERDT